MVIIAEQLSRRYGRRRGIEGVELRIGEGEIFGFLGPNGAGKTTTIRLLLGFLRASGGRATVFGLDCWRSSAAIKQEVGYLPGDLRLYPWMSGLTALRIWSRIRRRPQPQFGLELADRLSLEMTLPVRKMSRGMRQKLGLILALAHRPRLLVLDEPSTGLDPLMQQQLAECLRQLAHEGSTVFFSSHTLSEVEQLCDRVAVVREGRIVADEPLESLRRRAGRTVTVLFDDASAARHAAPPDFLKIGERSGARWSCQLQGSAPQLIRWAAGQPISDLTIGRADLDSLFRGFYASPQEPP